MLFLIEPPKDAQQDVDKFGYWLKAACAKLVSADMPKLKMQAVVNQYGDMLLAIEGNEETAQRVRAALYN